MTANKYRDHIIVSCALGCEFMISALTLQANNIRSPLKSTTGIASLSLCPTVHVHVHTRPRKLSKHKMWKKKQVSPYDRRIARRNSNLSGEVADKLMFFANSVRRKLLRLPVRTTKSVEASYTADYCTSVRCCTLCLIVDVVILSATRWQLNVPRLLAYTQFAFGKHFAILPSVL